MERWMLKLYSALVFMTVALFLTPWERLTRRRRGRGSELLPQWLGEPRADPPPADLLIHAVSAGEMAAAGGIARQLLALRPDTRLLLTTGTDAGERMAERLAENLPGQVGIRRLPWDRAAATQDWLYRLSPRALVVVETELWPNLFFACRRLGIPLAVASARLYTSDVARYRWIKGFMARVLDCPRWIGVQDETERQRFIAIGADPSRLRILGNAKAARRPPVQRSPAGTGPAALQSRRTPGTGRRGPGLAQPSIIPGELEKAGLGRFDRGPHRAIE
jgi:3-deoxy-D-manno-octulosonic-acid transferase